MSVMSGFFVFCAVAVAIAALVIALKQSSKVDALRKQVDSLASWASQGACPPAQQVMPNAQAPFVTPGAQPWVGETPYPTSVPQQPVVPFAPAIAEPVPLPLATPPAPSATYPPPTGMPAQVTSPTPAAYPAPTETSAQVTSPIATAYPAPTGTPIPTYAPAAGAPQGPAFPSPTAQQPAIAPTTTPPKNTENLMGRNVLAIVASALAFIGLIYLGILVVPHLPDWSRITLMFVISAGVGLLGYALHRSKPTVLTQALLGTGAGGLFISIMVTHLYFHALSDVVAFSLLAIWLVASLWLTHHAKSFLMAILAHVGMVASVGAAYLFGLSDDKIILVVAYQIVSTVVLIVGNFIWTRQTYRFSLFASQALFILSAAAMWANFAPHGTLETSLPIPLVIGAFAVQFVGSTIVTYLLFVSCARVKDRTMMAGLAALNSVLWAVVATQCVPWLIYRMEIRQHGGLGGVTPYLSAYPVPVATFIVVLAVPVALIALARPSFSLPAVLRTATVVPLAVASGLALLVNLVACSADYKAVSFPAFSWFIVLAGVYLGLGALASSRAYMWIGRALLAIDALCMVVMGYQTLTHVWTVWASLAYLALLIGLGVAMWWRQTPAVRNRYVPFFIAAMFLGGELSLGSIVDTAHLKIGWGLFSLVTALVLCGIHVFKKDRPTLFYRIVEFLAALWVTAILIFAEPIPVPITLGLASVAVLIGLFVDRIRLSARTMTAWMRAPGSPQPSTAIEILSALGISVSAIGIVSPWKWYSAGYPVSLALMVVALVLVGLGIWSRVKALRLYGLVLVCLCVFKLVLFDIGSVDSITRVVAFLGGALVCFGISALYNFAAKHFDKDLGREPVVPGGYMPMSLSGTQEQQAWPQSPGVAPQANGSSGQEFFSGPAPHPQAMPQEYGPEQMYPDSPVTNVQGYGPTQAYPDSPVTSVPSGAVFSSGPGVGGPAPSREQS